MKLFTLVIDEGARVRTLSEAQVNALLRGDVGASLRCAISGAEVTADFAFVVRREWGNVIVSRPCVREAESRTRGNAIAFARFAFEAREQFSREQAEEKRRAAVARTLRMSAKELAGPARGIRNDRAARAAQQNNAWCQVRQIA